MSSKKSLHNLAVLSLVAVAASYPFLSIAARLLDVGFESMTQVYLRVALASVVGTVLLRKKIRWEKIRAIPSNDWLPLALMGIVGYALFVYFITLGALNSKLLNVAIVFSTTPFFAFIYSYFVFKKTLRSSQMLLVAATFTGVAIVASKSYVPVLTGFGTGELYTFIAAGLFAWYLVGRKMLSKHLNNSEVSVVVMAIAALSAFVLSLFAGEHIRLESFYRWEVIVGLVLGASLNILATYLESFALLHLDATLSSQILLLENVFASLFGYLLYAEILTMPEIIGGLIVIGSVYAAHKYS